jgi:hypothetical protein
MRVDTFEIVGERRLWIDEAPTPCRVAAAKRAVGCERVEIA